jgi:four helix bundle protein
MIRVFALATRSMAEQLRRSATSTAQNYAACTIARSRRDFVSKLRVALEEADESARWLRILNASAAAANSQMTKSPNDQMAGSGK